MLEAVSLSPGSLCCLDPAMSLTHTCCDSGLLILLKLALDLGQKLGSCQIRAPHKLSNIVGGVVTLGSQQCQCQLLCLDILTVLECHIFVFLAQLDSYEHLLDNCIERLGAKLPPGST